MNRSDFLKSIGIGAVMLPAILNAVSEPQTRTLIEWLDDVRDNHTKVTFIGSPDTIEYFRRNFFTSRNAIHTSFTLEQYPYRYDENFKIVSPYINAVSGGQRISAINMDWINAPTEVCIAYAGSTIFWAPFNRKTYRLLPA